MQGVSLSLKRLAAIVSTALQKLSRSPYTSSSRTAKHFRRIQNVSDKIQDFQKSTCVQSVRDSI